MELISSRVRHVGGKFTVVACKGRAMVKFSEKKLNALQIRRTLDDYIESEFDRLDIELLNFRLLNYSDTSSSPILCDALQLLQIMSKSKSESHESR